MLTAVEQATQVLTGIAIILLLGLLLSIIARKFRLSSILVLMVAGIFLGQFTTFSFSPVFLIAIAVMTLVMVVFDGSSRFELKMVNLYSLPSLRVTMFFLFFNMVFLTIFTTFFFVEDFSVTAMLFALVFSIVMSGTDPGSVFILLKSRTNKVIEFLEVEAIINTPVIVILPFIILDIINNITASQFAQAVANQVVPFLQQIIVGVGTGMLIGVIVFKSMRKFYSQNVSPIALVTATLLAYIVSENLDGNGVLAVATLGMFFGNIIVKEKESLQEFNSMLSNSLIILVYIIIGMIIKIDLSALFLFKALGVFAALVITRLSAISLGLRGNNFSAKEKIFMALSMPKGIAVAVVAFSLSVFPVPVAIEVVRNTLLQLIVVMMVYSLILSSVIDRFSQKFIRIKLVKDN